jgi:hypothetical protein
MILVVLNHGQSIRVVEVRAGSLSVQDLIAPAGAAIMQPAEVPR